MINDQASQERIDATAREVFARLCVDARYSYILSAETAYDAAWVLEQERAKRVKLAGKCMKCEGNRIVPAAELGPKYVKECPACGGTGKANNRK